MTSLFRELTPVPMASSASTTTTSRRALASARATARPTTPARITRHSTASMAAFSASGRRLPTPPRRRSDQHHAAIRHDDLSGDIVGVARREEGRDSRKVVGLRRIAEQDAGREALDELTLFLDDALVDHVLLEPVPQRRHHHARREGIDRDLVLGEFEGARLGKRDNGRLARAIGCEFRIALSTSYRRGVDDLTAASLGHHLARSLLCAEKHPKGVALTMVGLAFRARCGIAHKTTLGGDRRGGANESVDWHCRGYSAGHHQTECRGQDRSARRPGRKGGFRYVGNGKRR